MLSSLVVALQGFTSTPLAIALQGFVVIEVPLQVTGGGGGWYVRRKVKAARRLNDFLDKVLREELVEELVEDAVEAVKELAEEKQSARSALTEFVEETHKEMPDVRFISTLDLVTWLQEQNPEVVKELMARPTQAQ